MNMHEIQQAAAIKREREQMPLMFVHSPNGPHLKTVIDDMLRLGAPKITCVYTDEAVYALEGVHRLHAASYQFLQFGATLDCWPVDHVLTEDEWSRLTEGNSQWLLGARSWGRSETAGDIVEHVRGMDGWTDELRLYRNQISGPGVHEKTSIFGGRSAWHYHIKKPYPTPSERLRVKPWDYDAEENKYRVSAGRFSATVFPRAGGGWGVWIGTKDVPKFEKLGTLSYATIDVAKEAAIAAVAYYETLTRSELGMEGDKAPAPRPSWMP